LKSFENPLEISSSSLHIESSREQEIDIVPELGHS